MRADEFIATNNYQRVLNIKDALLAQSVNLSIALVLGRAGRGKTSAVRRIAAQDSSVIYWSFTGWTTAAGLLREVCFAVAGERPRHAQVCFDHLQNSFRERRRVVVDEADRMGLKHLNILRDLHDHCGVGLVLVGEEPLRSLVGRERRLISRVAQEVTFQPVSMPDVILYFQRALDLELSPSQATALAGHSQGDFRLVVKDALAIERLLKVNGLKSVTDQLVKDVTK